MIKLRALTEMWLYTHETVIYIYKTLKFIITYSTLNRYDYLLDFFVAMNYCTIQF